MVSAVTRGCSHIGRPSRILSLGRDLPHECPERTGVALVELSVDPCAVVSFEILEGVAKTEGGDGNGWRRGLVYD